MLHVAAQGDQPASLLYFMRKGLSINTGDKKDSAPIHWASFAGAELALSYLLAWKAGIIYWSLILDVNAQDSKGLTALHLAVKASEEVRNTKSIK